MGAAIEGQMLPDLVADGDDVVAHAPVGQHLQLFGAIDPGGRVQRIVEEDDPGPGRGDLFQRLGGDPPLRRLQPDETGDAAH